MLDTIRNNKDNFFLKTLFTFIVVSFLGAGFIAMFTDIIWGEKSNNVVTFSKTDNITIQEYAQQRAEDLKRLQNMSGANWDQEKLEEIGFNKILLQKLISKSMIEYLAKTYNLTISEETIVKLLMKDPNFQDENGNFDKVKFKSLFHNSSMSEEEYIRIMQGNIASSLLVDIFASSFATSDIMLDNITQPMAERMSFDIYSVDLNKKPKNYRPIIIEEDKVSKFYADNISLFVLPELRKVNYLIFDEKMLRKKLDIKDSEVSQYYKENKDELTSKEAKKAKKEARDILEKARVEELQIELANELEGYVSDGLSLEEIAEKYNAKIYSSNLISRQAMLNGAEKKLQSIADEVFELAESEVSYPIESSDNKIYLAMVSSKVSPRTQKIEEARAVIIDKFNQEILFQENYAKLNKYYKEFDSSKAWSKQANKTGVNRKQRTKIQRAELLQDTTLPIELSKHVAYSKAREKTKIIIDGSKAYFVFVKEAKLDKALFKQLKESARMHIANNIKQGVMQDLIDYLTKENDMQLNLPELSRP